jgi:hypothetical protein
VKLLVAISHHGLGHLAQAAPVLGALRALRPDLGLTIWSGLSRAALAARIPFPFEHRHAPADVGLAMADAVRVDVAASHGAYLAFHQDWDRRVAGEADWFLERGFRGVFSDVAYLPLAAASRAGLPSVALCSLNWRDIAAAYLAEQPGMARLLEQMAEAYAAARAFLRPTPAMPMEWLRRGEDIPPIAALGRDRRPELMPRIGGRQDSKWVLMGFGGIGYRGEGHLPELAGLTWMVPDDWTADPPKPRSDVVAFGDLGVPFLDLLASCDALVTKVGYGGFVEAAAHGKPVLYIDRPDWPETPCLSAWLAHSGNCLAIMAGDLFSARTGGRLERLCALPPKPRVAADGAGIAARRLLELLA